MVKVIIASLVVTAIVGLTGIAIAQTSPTPATPVLPPAISVVPSQCPCEFRLDAAPQGVSGFEFRFVNTEAARVGVTPRGYSWQTGPDLALDVVVRHTVFAYGVVDLTDQIQPGDTDILLFTFDGPNAATTTSIVIDDDNGKRFLTWP